MRRRDDRCSPVSRWHNLKFPAHRKHPPCTDTFQGGDKKSVTWEEGSLLKEYPYKATGGTGKYLGASGGGTYFYEILTDTLFGGKYKGKMELP